MLHEYPNLCRLASRISGRFRYKKPTKRAMITGLLTLEQIEEAEWTLGQVNDWLNHLFYGKRVNTLNYVHILETIDNKLCIRIVLLCAKKHFYYEQVFFK